MTIKHIWSVLCKESVINQDDNLVSMFGVLEELNLDLKPLDSKGTLPEKIGIPLNYEVVSLWTREKKDKLDKADLEIVMINPEGTELLKINHTIEFPVNVRRFRSRIKISGLPVTKAGDYNFKIKVREDVTKDYIQVAELPIEVKIKLLSSGS